MNSNEKTVISKVQDCNSLANAELEQKNFKEVNPMRKRIPFILSKQLARSYGYKGNGYKVEEDFEVNLDKLSPAARFIAEGIYTTDNSDDLSNIRVYGDTPRNLMLRDNVPAEEIELQDKVFGRLDEPVNTIWLFDGLRTYESPEFYFERQVEKMKNLGWLKMETCHFEEKTYTF